MTHFELFCFVFGVTAPLIVSIAYGIYDTISKRKADKEKEEEDESLLSEEEWIKILEKIRDSEEVDRIIEQIKEEYNE